MKVKLLLTFALLLTAVTGAWADDSGSCGEVSYSYVESTHTLTISGTGAMADYDDSSEQPWNSYAADIETLIIEDGVTSIGAKAFRECSSMTTVTIGTGVTYIGYDAFYLCTAVTDVYCNANPAALTWEEGECDDFKSDGTTIIHVENADPWYAKFYDVVNGHFRDSNTVPFDWSYDSDTKTLTFIGTEPIPSYNDPDDRPWKDYVSEVEKIVISDGVWGIGSSAFCECSALTSVTIPASVKSIGTQAFYVCEGLTTVTIGTGVTYIGYDAFYLCTAVTDVYCNANPAALTWEEGECDDFKSDGTTVIHVANADPWYAKFGGEVHGIFRDPSTVPFSWNYDSGTKTLTFSGTEAIPSYNNPDERLWIDYVSEVENIVINEGVRGIGNYAFYDCASLTTVTIPASVMTIGKYAFENCSGLTTVTIPASVISIYTSAFAGCSNLATMTVDAGNTKYDSRNGCNAIIEKETNTLIAGCKNTKIPDDVTSIGENAFYDCDGLTTITIPASVTSIGDYAFDGCSNLATMTVEAGNTVYDSRNGCNAIIEKESNTLIVGCKNTKIPDDVTSIGDFAFEGCISLTTVTIPAGVTRIGSRAFEGCDGLTTVTIGSGVTYIGYDAFFNCTAVTDVYCYADPTKLTWDEGGCDDFMYDGSTKCHVTDAAPWSDKFDGDVNVDFVGDLAPEATTNEAGAEYWSSYYNSAAHLKADDNTTVYKATLSGTTVTLTEITNKVITAGQAVLLKKTTADPVELTPCAAASTDDYSGNDLEGVDVETAKESSSDYYVLSYQNAKLSFYKYSGATLGANKAFFKIPANSSRDFLDIVGDVTGIDVISKMSDGRSDVYYDLNGRRVMNPTKKGIYINNGQKVVIK